MVKPGETKPSYDGRAGYPPCQPIKHGTNGANGHRPNGGVSQPHSSAPISPSADSTLATSASGRPDNPRNLSHVPPYQVSNIFFYYFIKIV